MAVANTVEPSTKSSVQTSSKIITSDKNDSFKSVVGKLAVSKNVNNDDMSKSEDTKDAKIDKYLKKLGFTDDEIKGIKDKIKDENIDVKSVLFLFNLLFGNSENDKDTKSDEFLSKLADNISNIIIDYVKNNNQSGSYGDINLEDIKNGLNNVFDSESNILTYILSELNQRIQTKDEEKLLDKNVLKNLTDILIPSADDKSDFVQKFLNTMDNSGKLSSKIADDIVLKLSQIIPNSETVTDTSDIKMQIYTELFSKITDGSSDISLLQTQEDSGNVIENTILCKLATIKDNLSESMDVQNDSSQKKQNSGSFTENNDTSTLDKILGNSEVDSKISRAVNFMTQFNNVKSDDVILANNIQGFTINKNTFNSDIIKSLEYMEINNVKEMTVKIIPKELGSITINLVMQDGQMNAVLTTSNKDAYNILNSNLQDISEKLQNIPIKVQNFSLNSSEGDTTFFRDESRKGQYNQEKNSSKLNSVNSIFDDEVPEEEDDYYSSSVNMLA